MVKIKGKQGHGNDATDNTLLAGGGVVSGAAIGAGGYGYANQLGDELTKQHGAEVEALKKAQETLTAANNADGVKLAGLDAKVDAAYKNLGTVQGEYNDYYKHIVPDQQLTQAQNQANAAYQADQAQGHKVVQDIRDEFARQIAKAEKAHDTKTVHALQQQLCQFNDNHVHQIKVIQAYVQAELAQQAHAQTAFNAANADLHGNILTNAGHVANAMFDAAKDAPWEAGALVAGVGGAGFIVAELLRRHAAERDASPAGRGGNKR